MSMTARDLHHDLPVLLTPGGSYQSLAGAGPLALALVLPPLLLFPRSLLGGWPRALALRALVRVGACGGGSGGSGAWAGP